jgi:hypothetical protein
MVYGEDPSSVPDRQGFDADPDQAFRFDAGQGIRILPIDLLIHTMTFTEVSVSID